MASAKLQELVLLGYITFYLIITLIILSYITVGLRLWVRYRITKSPGWDDAAMVATLLLFTCYCSFILVITFRSRQRKLFNLEDIRVTLIYVQLGEIFYILTTTLLKVSLGLFFLRILTKRWQTFVFHVILGVSATYGLFYVFVAIFQCGDPAKLADSLIGSKNCLPSAFLLTTGYLYGVINVIADWTFVLIPISVLIDSDLDRQAKISVSVVMGLGAIGSVSSILRMVYLKGLFFGGGELTATSIKATIFATAEPGTGMIAASIAILRPLIRQISCDIHTKVSEYGSRKSSYRNKGSLPSISNPVESDTIALTSQAGKKTSLYSIRSDDPWSPTVVVGTANVQRVMSAQMINGRGSPAPSRI
ncbi:Nn.00g006720.m01.CDS01 [Neocucurbitaria sp. VM-36]